MRATGAAEIRAAQATRSADGSGGIVFTDITTAAGLSNALNVSGTPDDKQFLLEEMGCGVAPMKSPVELAGPRVLLADNDTYVWERTEEKEASRGLAEGPQILEHGGRTFLIYSTAASWLPTYKLGLMELTGEDPLDPAAWKKHSEPVFRSNDTTFGTGHGGFVKSPDNSQWWHVYHAKRDRGGNWLRSIFLVTRSAA